MEVGPGRPGAVIDSEDGVRVTGARPGAMVTITTELSMMGRSWSCRGEYVADGSGTVETAAGSDPFDLFWDADLEGPFDWSQLRPMSVTAVATCEGDRAEAAYERGWLAPGARVEDVSEPGVVGRLFRPPGSRRAPGLVALAGSGGGLGSVPTAALLTGHGVATLALAVWRHPGTPEVMREIDLDVVGRGCDWLRAQDGVADRPPAVLGVSRGGELALLAGAHLPDRVGPVVSDVGSGVPWGALGPGTDVNETAWTWQGRAVPQVHEDEDDPDAVLDDAEAVAAAEIPVERCSGRVLLMSGQDDRMWPSARLSQIAADRAARLGVADRVQHVSHPDAGHASGAPPGFPTPRGIRHPVDGRLYAFGGTREGNQKARVDNWRRLRALLEEDA